MQRVGPMRTALLATVASTLLLSVQPARAAEPKLITTQELVARMGGAPASKWNFTLVDARTQVEFDDAHIPGAILVPAKRVGELLPKPVPDRSRTVIFYCNGPNCTKTVKAAAEAAAAGYTDIVEYKEGLPAWRSAGRKVDGTPLPKIEVEAVKPEVLAAMLRGRTPPAVIDIRDADEFPKFRILQARNIPIDELTKQRKTLPTGQEIILVCHAGHQSPVAARLLASFGITKVRRLDGGMLEWRAAGLPTTK